MHSRYTHCFVRPAGAAGIGCDARVASFLIANPQYVAPAADGSVMTAAGTQAFLRANPDCLNDPTAPWSVNRSAAQPASTTTVSQAAADAAIPIALVGLVGLAIGGYTAYRFVRRWGKK